MATQPLPGTGIKPKAKTRPRSPANTPKKKMVSLSLGEKLFILAIDDEGAVPASMKTTLRYGLAGALLAELALANKVLLEDGHLTLVDPAPSGDPFLDDILQMIAAEKKPRKLRHWLQAVRARLTIKQVAGQLVERKVIVVEKKRFLWVIPYELFPMVDASAKYWVKRHLRGVLLAGEPVEGSDIPLLSLLMACRLLGLVFTRDERRSAEKKVDALVQGEVFGQCVAKILTAIEAGGAVAAASS